MTQHQVPSTTHDRAGRPAADQRSTTSARSTPASPVPLAVRRSHDVPAGGPEHAEHPLGRLRRAVTPGVGGVIRRDKTKTKVKKKTPQELADEQKPQSGTTYTLAEARAKLKSFDHNQSGVPFRKQIAGAWADYIFATFSTLKAGVVRDTYKSSFDKGHVDEFSVSQEIDGIPEIVIHAHMDKDGKPKPGNGVHWKWEDGEKVAESYEMSSALVAKLLDSAKAKTSWTTKVSLPTGSGTGTPTPTPTTPTPPTTPVTTTVTPTLPTT